MIVCVVYDKLNSPPGTNILKEVGCQLSAPESPMESPMSRRGATNKIVAVCIVFSDVTLAT